MSFLSSSIVESRSRIIRTRTVWPGGQTLAQADNSAAPAGSPAPSVVTITQVEPSSTGNQYDSGSDHNSTHKLSSIMPAFLIACVCFMGMLLACGLMRTRRRRMARLRDAESSPSPTEDSERPKKPKKKRPVKPTLWEVDVKGSQWEEKDLESLHPIAVELQADPWPYTKSGRKDDKRSLWFVPGLSRPHKPQEVTPAQQAQVTVMVSMPAPNRRPGGPSNEIAIGTAMVPYRDEDSDEEDMDDSEVFDRNGITYAYH